MSFEENKAAGVSNNGGAGAGGEEKLLTGGFGQFLTQADAGSTTQAWTWCSKRALKHAYDAVQLVALNFNATPYTIAGALIASTDNVDYVGAGDTAWQPYNGGTKYPVKDVTTHPYGWRTAAWPSGGVVPAKVGHDVGVLIANRTPLKSFAALDGLYHMLMRVYVDATTSGVSWKGRGTNFKTSAFNAGLPEMYANLSGDNVTTNFSLSAGAANGNQILVFPRFFGVEKLNTLMTIGDSITGCGGLVADQESSWGWRAAKARGFAGYYNFGAPGQTSDYYWGAAKAALQALKPTHAVYSAWTPNDNPYTDAGVTGYKVALMMAKVVEFIEICSAQGTKPILWTGLPYNILAQPADDVRKSFNAQLLAYRAKGIAVIDMCAICGDGATPERWIPSKNYATDGVHPNEATVQEMANALEPFLT